MVGVEERVVETPGHGAADGSLAGAHEANEKEIRAIGLRGHWGIEVKQAWCLAASHYRPGRDFRKTGDDNTSRGIARFRPWLPDDAANEKAASASDAASQFTASGPATAPGAVISANIVVQDTRRQEHQQLGAVVDLWRCS